MDGVVCCLLVWKKKSKWIVKFSGSGLSITGLMMELCTTSSHLPSTPSIFTILPLPLVFHFAGKSPMASFAKSSENIMVLPGTKSENEVMLLFVPPVVPDVVLFVLTSVLPDAVADLSVVVAFA